MQHLDDLVTSEDVTSLMNLALEVSLFPREYTCDVFLLACWLCAVGNLNPSLISDPILAQHIFMSTAESSKQGIR